MTLIFIFLDIDDDTAVIPRNDESAERWTEEAEEDMPDKMYSDEIRPEISEFNMEYKSKSSRENSDRSETAVRVTEKLEDKIIRDTPVGLPEEEWTDNEILQGERPGSSNLVGLPEEEWMDNEILQGERPGSSNLVGLPEEWKDKEGIEERHRPGTEGGVVDEIPDVKELVDKFYITDENEELLNYQPDQEPKEEILDRVELPPSVKADQFPEEIEDTKESDIDEEKYQPLEPKISIGEVPLVAGEVPLMAERIPLMAGEEDEVEPKLKLEPLEDGNYMKIRNLLSQLNNALYTYSNKLTKEILKGNTFKKKVQDCTTKYGRLFSECKAIAHDKITLQQHLDDLRNKYSTMEQTLTKVKDLNEDNRQTIDKLRATRDQCLRTVGEKTKTIENLRYRSVVLRRQLSRFREKI